jgi:RNA polymerase sigma factor (sigma-70 family)
MKRRGPRSNLEVANRLAEVVARRYSEAFERHIGLDELRELARKGAADALDKWDGRGHFEPFAMQRIRWAIISGARRWFLRHAALPPAPGDHALVATGQAADSVDETPEELELAPRDLADQSLVRYRLDLRLAREEAEYAADQDQNPEHAADRLRVRRAVAALPPPEDEVVKRHAYEDESFQEIADALSLSKSTVGDAYHRGVRRLQEWLDPPPPPAEPPPAPLPLRRSVAPAAP